MEMEKSSVVLGAGITGLAAAWKIARSGKPVIVIEKEADLGGLASSFKSHGFSLDYGPHKIYTQLPHILREMKSLLGDELLEVDKKCSIRIQGKYLSYPFVFSELALKLSPITGLKCGISYMLSLIENKISHKEDRTYEDFIVRRFGWETYKLVFEPYAHKVWGNPKKLDAELARVRIAVPSMLELVKRTLFGDSNKREISAKTFFYPKKGIIEMSDRMGNEIRKTGKIYTQTTVKEIRLKGKRIDSIIVERNGKQQKLQPETVISTLPIGLAVSMIRPTPPENVLRAARNLKYQSLILVYLIIRKKKVMNDCWIFYPEKEFIFNRLSEQKKFSKYCCPPDKTAITAELTCEESDPIWNMDDKALIKKISQDIERAGVVSAEFIESAFVIRKKKVYPTYLTDFESNLDIIMSYFEGIENLLTNGRLGLYAYSNTDHCMDMGFESAKCVITKSKRPLPIVWKAVIENKFKNYLIID